VPVAPAPLHSHDHVASAVGPESSIVKEVLVWVHPPPVMISPALQEIVVAAVLVVAVRRVQVRP